jgi:hypothetical protein
MKKRSRVSLKHVAAVGTVLLLVAAFTLVYALPVLGETGAGGCLQASCSFNVGLAVGLAKGHLAHGRWHAKAGYNASVCTTELDVDGPGPDRSGHAGLH